MVMSCLLKIFRALKAGILRLRNLADVFLEIQLVKA